jgi:1-hydroxycarotenoid 3,4-desaturase
MDLAGARCCANPGLLPTMAPWRTLARLLARRFPDPRLAQLFGRYATYVGGSPYGAPALAGTDLAGGGRGVWVVEGRHAPAGPRMRALARARGAFHYGARRRSIRDGRRRA